MADVMFTRHGWFPAVVVRDSGLRIEWGAGADANHEPRTFSIPVDDARAAVISTDLRRHLLLWSALRPLCVDAGTEGALDEEAALVLRDLTLLGTPDEIDAAFRGIRWDWRLLMAHGGDIELLDDGRVWTAMEGATESSGTARVAVHDANRRRARRGVTLAPIDTAILRYTGQYLHGGATLPKRLPGEVDPVLLPDVLRVIAAAERACAGMHIGRDPRGGERSCDKEAWERVTAAVTAAVREVRPELVDDSVDSVSFLMCSEIVDRSRGLTAADDAEASRGRTGVTSGARAATLTFTDEKEVEQTWSRGGPRDADVAFWEFVAHHAGADNEVFTIEDEELGEGLQLHFYADSLARITTVERGEGGSEPQYRVEYGLVNGLEGYRVRVRAFVAGGCAALDPLGPWIADVEEFERERRRRRDTKS